MDYTAITDDEWQALLNEPVPTPRVFVRIVQPLGIDCFVTRELRTAYVRERLATGIRLIDLADELGTTAPILSGISKGKR